MDVSDSVPAADRAGELQFINESLKLMPAADKAGLMVFGREPFLEKPVASTLDMSDFRAAAPGDSTNIDSALRAASSDMPDNYGKRIILMSDGEQNAGDAAAAAEQLRREGTDVDIAPAPDRNRPSFHPEVLIESVSAPARVNACGPFSLRVVLQSNIAQAAALKVERPGKVLYSAPVQIPVGKTAVVVPVTEDQGGLFRYDATLTPSQNNDTFSQNNSSFTVVSVQGQPRVLYISNSGRAGGEYLPAALRSQGMKVVMVNPGSSPQTTGDFAGYDSVLLSDVAATDFSPQQLMSLAKSNRSLGVGLGMIGGVDSFAAGGYAGTPIEDVLPVDMKVESKKRLPSADVVIVLDASGSMSEEENGTEKVELGAQAAINLLKALQPDDRVAVLAVTTEATIVVPLEPPAMAASAETSIEGLEAGGGGIDCLTALQAAYDLLITSDASIKHVIICPDTTDSEQQEGCVSLAGRMLATQHISTSVCGIGHWGDSDVPFQKNVAAAGGGQLFIANQAGNLPLFFQRDVQQIQQHLFLETPASVAAAPYSLVSPQELSSAPQLLGFNLATPKHLAAVSVSTSTGGYPILATWRAGLGKSFAFMGDDQDHWSRNWVAWNGFGPLWAHVVRWSLRDSEDDTFQSLATISNNKVHIAVDAFSRAGGYLNGAPFQASVIAPDQSSSAAPLQQTEPGRYEGTFNASSLGEYTINIRNGASSPRGQTIGLANAYSPEYRSLKRDSDFLASLSLSTGGQVLTTAAQVFRYDRAFPVGDINLTFPLLLASGFFFLADIAFRRMGWRLSKTNAVRLRPDPSGFDRATQSVVPSQTRVATSVPRQTERAAEGEPKRADRDTRQNVKELVDDDPFPFVASLRKTRDRKESDDGSSNQ